MGAIRGRPRALTKDLIIDAVLAEGLDTFSLPTIAARLGVAHSGLYRYFEDREDLVVHTMTRIAQSAPWPAIDLPWREQLEQIGEAIWTMCDTYPGYDLAALRTRNVSPGFVSRLTPYVDSLHHQGLSVIDATAAIEFIRTLVLTSAIEATRLKSIADRRDLPDHSIPGFADPEKWAGRGWYDRHLNTWLDGLAQRIT
ncbi:TetR/AcrR family transcriptional regulator [Aeromicrobium sp.]|uniref:TetR/AcrR family transcriptional regulator n=1 Tax=Aeromicrobium sp. TaxID=1871063 RepID=UPI0030C43172